MSEAIAMPNPLEYAVIGDFLTEEIGPVKMRELVREHGLKPVHFTDPALRSAFELMMADASDNIPGLRAAVQAKISVETVGRALERSDITSVNAGDNIRRLAWRGCDGEIIGVVTDVIAQSGDNASPSFKVNAIVSEIRRKIITCDAIVRGISLGDIADPIPEDQDPNCLFKGRFLSKGGGMMLVSHSGVGKSVITMQFAYAWALGRTAFGIVPLRKLRIGIFQTEDDEQDMAGFKASMRKGFMGIHGWTQEEFDEAGRNIVIYNPEGRMGADFAAHMRDVQMKEHFDLIVINPLQGVTGFDISQNANLSKFLRSDIDSVIKDEETKCGLMIVHHTNKPPTQNDRYASVSSDLASQYIGAGGAELINWMRAMMVIKPTSECGKYLLSVPKRGKKLSWQKNPNDKSVHPSRSIRHSNESEGIEFWQECDSDASMAGCAQDGLSSGRQVKADAEKVAELLREGACTLTEARKLAKDCLGRSRGELIYRQIIDNPIAYGLVIERTGTGNQAVMGSAEGVKKWFSTLRGKMLFELQSKFA